MTVRGIPSEDYTGLWKEAHELRMFVASFGTANQYPLIGQPPHVTYHTS